MKIALPTRNAEVIADVDVCVAGAGPAGIGAALAAARTGARVFVAERHGFCGGNFTAASVGTVCGLYVRDGGSWSLVTRGIAEEVATALQAAGRATGPVPFKETAVLLYVPWAAKRLFDHLLTSEPTLTLALHTWVADVVREGDRIVAVVLATKQGPKAVRARAFVDATGDADLVYHAGAPWEMAPPGLRQHASMQFVMQHVDVGSAMAAGLETLARLIAEHGAHLSRDSGALLPTFRPGEVIGAMTRVARPDGAPLDVTDPADATYGEIEGRRLAEEAAAFLVEHMPGFAEAFLADTGVCLGVRESRRAVGGYVLTGADVTGLARFADAVACCAWPREYHVSGRSTRYEFLPPGAWFQIPHRSLRVRGLANLWVGGRCVSADPDALASVRVMAPSMALGQAAGIAAVLHSRGELTDAALQAALAGQGAFLG